MNDEAGSVVKACRILKCFRAGESLRLRDLVSRTSLSKTTVHRLLRTLEKAEMIERAGPAEFRTRFLPTDRKAVRIGFGAQTASTTFARLVSESIHRAARAYGVELIVADNRYSAKTALHNTELLIQKKVDLALEFQTYESVASAIASRFLQAGIPVIAIEIPHPGATYFGADNYRAGLLGGHALARWAKDEWNGQIEEVLLLRERVAGSLPGARVSAMHEVIQRELPHITDAMVVELDGKGASKHSYEAVHQYLRHRPPRRTLVAANNDPTAVGALKAFEDLKRLELCAVMSQNCVFEAREEMRRPGSRMVGSVAYFPERYGEQLLPLALSIVNGKPAPPAMFVKHTMVTPGNVQRIYPLEKDHPS